MADGLENSLTFFLEAEDLASGLVTDAQAAMDASAEGVENTLLDLTTSLEEATGVIDEGAADVALGVGQIAAGFQEALTLALAGIDDITETTLDLVEATDDNRDSLGAMNLLLGETTEQVMVAEEVTEQWTLTLGALGTAGVAGVSAVAGAVTGLGKGLVSAGNTLDNFGSRAGALGGIVKTVSTLVTGLGATLGGAGLVGFLLGPLAPILGLLTPIFDFLMEQLAPVFDIIGAAIENAFAPFQFILETVMQSLMPVIQDALNPLVGILTAMAIQVGAMLQNLRLGDGGFIASIVETMAELVPVVMRVVQALAEAAQRVLPAIGKMVTAFLPVVVKLVEILADAFIGRIEAFTDVIVEVGPLLATTFADLLMALIPLIEPLTKLGTLLIKHVFAPAVIAAVQLLAAGIQALTPVIEEVSSVLGALVEMVNEALADFFGPKLGKYVSDFNVLFIEPIKAAVQGVIDYATQLVNVFRMEGVFEGVKKIVVDYFGFLGSAITKILELVGLAEEKAEGEGAGLAEAAAEQQAAGVSPEVVGALEAQSQGDRDEFNKRMRALKAKGGGLAEGGIAVEPTTRLFGEAGPEAVLPLKADVIQEFVAPVLKDMELPGMDEAVELLQGILGALRGTLTVRGMAGEERGQAFPAPGKPEAADDRGIGMLGFVAG